MSVTAQALEDPSSRGADLRLAVIGALTVLFSITAFAAGMLGTLPTGLSSAIVMFGMAIGLKVVWTYVARSATSASRTRITTLMSNVGLGISTLAVIAALPRLSKAGGVELMLIDLLARVWTIGIITAVAGPVRTLGWRAFTGAFLFGFLGLTGFARFLGRPVILALGSSNVFAVAIWVPLTEEICKMIPVILVLVLALRRTEARPSLLDLVLIGCWAAAGFAVYENSGYGRGGFSLTAIFITSLFFPDIMKGSAFGWTVAQNGHMVHTALIALGVGFAFLYRRRLQRAWIVAAVAIAVALVEHCSQNAISTGRVNEIIGRTLLAITLNGRLSSILLIAGIAYVATIEWRAVGAAFQPREWLQLRPAETQRRGALLAALQASDGRAPTAHVAPRSGT
jgi:RsiW-degrading membrane proteinase PrsW (M82 family)